jgi:hypothetical protein
MRRRLLAALGLWVCIASPAAAESQASKVERLEHEVDELKREIQELKRERKEATRPQPVTPEPQAQAPVPSAPPAEEAAAKPGLLERVQIGGYGSVRFEANSARDENATFTLRRLVLTADASIAPRLRSYFELEFERFRELELERKVFSENGGLTIKQSVDGSDQSAIELEQAWLEYELAQPLKIRAGAVLVPLGRFNLNHDDNRWDLPRRSLVDRGVPVLPVKAAWDELGAGVSGEVPLGDQGSLGYQLYVVNGAVLQPDVESVLASVNKEGGKEKAFEAEFSTSSGTFGKDFKDSKAATGRLAYSPWLGQEIGGSFYRGRYTPDFLPGESITAFAVDGLSLQGPFELEGEYVHADFGDLDKVARAFAARAVADEVAVSGEELESVLEFALHSLAETRQGYWLEGRYRFRPAWLKESIFGRDFEDPVLTAVVRGEQVWLDGLLRELAFSDRQVTRLSKDDRRIDRITIGGSYRPVPLVAFQLAYEYTHVDKGGLSEVTNFLDTGEDEAHAVLLGAAFGF